jgi:hypothetical protein
MFFLRRKSKTEQYKVLIFKKFINQLNITTLSIVDSQWASLLMHKPIHSLN